jgi:hypothetical protein
MRNIRSYAARACAVACLLAIPAARLSAQAWSYPSFQKPTITQREFNFAIADGDEGGGTSLLFQWREGYGAKSQLSLDAGFADAEFADGVFFLGGQFGHQLLRSNASTPIDMMFTAGANAGFGDDFRIFRLPVGVSLGHRFPLEGALAITPYVHPRASIDFISIPDGESDSDVNVDFELGAGFEFSPQLAARFGFTVGDADSFGLSLAFTPGALRRR